MELKELKWYIVSQIGSTISKRKLLNNTNLLNKLKLEFEVENIDVVLDYLQDMGFSIATKKEPILKKEIETNEPSIKVYYIDSQPLTKTENIKKEAIHKNYISESCENYKTKMKAYYREKDLYKAKNNLSKSYYRENTNYHNS